MNKENKNNLTPKQIRFVDFYLVDFNATKAYKKAGYKYKNDDIARSLASRNVSKDNVQNEIKERLQKEHENNLELKTKIRRKYEKLAFLTITEFLNFGAKAVDDSNFDQSFVILKNTEDVNPEYLDCIKKIKQTSQGYEIEIYSATDALKALREMYGFDIPTKSTVELANKDGKVDSKSLVQEWMHANTIAKKDVNTDNII